MTSQVLGLGLVGHVLDSISGGYISSDSYPNLSQDAKNFTALSGSTYCCEQLFSRMKNTKTNSRSLLTNERLPASLRISTSTVGAEVDYLCKKNNARFHIKLKLSALAYRGLHKKKSVVITVLITVV